MTQLKPFKFEDVKVGTRLRLRNGDTAKVTEVSDSDEGCFPIKTINENTEHGLTFSVDGMYLANEPSKRDVVGIVLDIPDEQPTSVDNAFVFGGNRNLKIEKDEAYYEISAGVIYDRVQVQVNLVIAYSDKPHVAKNLQILALNGQVFETNAEALAEAARYQSWLDNHPLMKEWNDETI